MRQRCVLAKFFFFNDTATTEIYTLSLHDALPISGHNVVDSYTQDDALRFVVLVDLLLAMVGKALRERQDAGDRDRKSTRLNSSHANISYAVFCLKKKKGQLLDALNMHAAERLSSV